MPFCARKCPYCHFYNLGHDDAREAVWLDGLAREIAAVREPGGFAGSRLATLYFGGGTPSLLSDEGFERAADLALGIAPRSDRLEWTLELNPGDATPERMAAWRERGVNRISVGAQSFDARRLEFLGRTHGSETAARAVRAAADARFEEVSLDLIFNLEVPGATPADRRHVWARDLAIAFDLPITHLSLYGLTIEPGTGFDARARAGARLTVPDTAYAAEYRAACRAARRAGFEHYEVSSFSLPGHRSRHNAAYWTGAPYLGFGPAAHSFDGLRRWANLSSLTGWAEALATGGDPRAFVELLTPFQREIETLYLGLRRAEGVERDHPLLVGRAEPVVGALVREGVLAEREGRLACTGRGFLLLDGILERLTGAAGAPARDVASRGSWPGMEGRDSFDNVLGRR
ncbi:MAG TPA: coproporphyrinogen-III oxidase family protein [Gemmatimonadota bacterium]|nr:coproporphyrinogen-III oxidase family protein [Gemmatimonadota bacterium]